MSAVAVERGALLTCMKCGREAKTSDQQVARITYGWRIWHGTTVGGTEHHAVYCHICAGTAPEGEDGKVVGYSAHCSTCMEDLNPDDYPGGVTEEDADEWCDEHMCEPDTRVIEPKADKR